MTVPDTAVVPAPPKSPGGHVLAANWRSFPNVVAKRWVAECGRMIFDATHRWVYCIGAVFPVGQSATK
jgi:hypothetical protein